MRMCAYISEFITPKIYFCIRLECYWGANIEQYIYCLVPQYCAILQHKSKHLDIFRVYLAALNLQIIHHKKPYFLIHRMTSKVR